MTMEENPGSDWRQRDRGRENDLEISGPHIGIYGWRKKCLYLLILGLLILVIVNLALTLWVLKVMEFNTEGMGNLRVIPGGIQVAGQSYILGRLVASSIQAKSGSSMSFRATHNISLIAATDHHTSNSIALGNDRFDCTASRFRVSDLQGRTLFSADKNEVVVGADMLRASGPGGVTFEGSVQTPLVRAAPGSDLSLESPTRLLQVMAPAGITIESRAGDITATCLTDLKLQSYDGAIRLEAARVILAGLKTGHHRGPGASPRVQQSTIYQLCSCHNGKLFLAPSDGLCATDNENTICR